MKVAYWSVTERRPILLGNAPSAWSFLAPGHGRQEIAALSQNIKGAKMEEVSSEVLLQLSIDELGEVLEELTGMELTDKQLLGMRQLIEISGSLEAALAVLDEIYPSSEAA